MIEHHYTTAQVAALLNCSTDTILRLAQKGELRSVFVGSERRYPESGVEEYLAKRANRPAARANVSQLASDRRTT